MIKEKLSKNTALILWILLLTSYVFFLQKMNVDSLISEFFIILISIVFVGGWWNYIYKLHGEPISKYEHKHLWAVLSIPLPLVGFVLAICLALVCDSSDFFWCNDYATFLIIIYGLSIAALPLYILSEKT